MNSCLLLRHYVPSAPSPCFILVSIGACEEQITSLKQGLCTKSASGSLRIAWTFTLVLIDFWVSENKRSPLDIHFTVSILTSVGRKPQRSTSRPACRIASMETFDAETRESIPQEALWLGLEKQLEKVNKFLNTQIVDLERKLAGATEEIDRVKKLQSFLLEKGWLLDDGTGSLVVSLMVPKHRCIQRCEEEGCSRDAGSGPLVVSLAALESLFVQRCEEKGCFTNDGALNLFERTISITCLSWSLTVECRKSFLVRLSERD